MTGSFRIDTDARGLAVVTFDAPGSKVNLWSRAALDEFDALLDELAGRGDLTGVVFRSGKPDTFIAGADVAELADIDSPDTRMSRPTSTVSSTNAANAPPTR